MLSLIWYLTKNYRLSNAILPLTSKTTNNFYNFMRAKNCFLKPLIKMVVWSLASIAYNIIQNNATKVAVWFASNPELIFYKTLRKINCCIVIIQIVANIISNPDKDIHSMRIRKLFWELLIYIFLPPPQFLKYFSYVLLSLVFQHLFWNQSHEKVSEFVSGTPFAWL